MSRTLHADVKTAIATNSFQLVSLIKIEFPTGDLFVTDGARDTGYDGDVYLADGGVLKIGSVQESAALRVGTLSITFSGVDNTTYPALFLTDDYMHAPISYWKAIQTDYHTLVGDPILYFQGNLSGYKMDEKGGKSTVSVTCASHWANFEAVNGRRTNSNSQQIHFPNDLGFDFASVAVENILWGRT